MMKNILILARQRSGTNFLRGLLSSSGPVTSMGEVFQPNVETGQSTYDAWYNASSWAGKTPVTYDDAIELCDDFLAGIEKADEAIAVDVKYNSLLRTVGVWYSVADPPPIMAAAAQRGYLLIHLVRQNRLEHAISTMIAQETKEYVVSATETAVAQTKLLIKPDAVVNVARHYRTEAQACVEWLKLIRRKNRKWKVPIFMEYEELSSATPDALNAMISSIFDQGGGTMQRPVQAKTQKLVKDWRKRVSNAIEVEEVFIRKLGDGAHATLTNGHIQ